MGVAVALLVVAGTSLLVSAQEAVYRLGPGDVLDVAVWGQPELRATVEVRPDGYIGFPLAGDVEAAGLSPAELGRAIAARLEQYVRSPQVTVLVQRFRTIRAQVLGAVRQPGVYSLRPGASLAELVAMASGLVDDADPSAAVLTRPMPGGGTRQWTVDLEGILSGQTAAPVTALEEGDVLFGPRARPAFVMGEVRLPGPYIVRSGMRVLDLLGAAGGLSPQAAAEAATLTRQDPAGGRPQVMRVERIRRPGTWWWPRGASSSRWAPASWGWCSTG